VLPVEQTNGTPRAAAKYTGLDFVPLLWETFDLLRRQRSYFRPPIPDDLHFPETSEATRCGPHRL
jgi:hypothetical protein